MKSLSYITLDQRHAQKISAGGSGALHEVYAEMETIVEGLLLMVKA